MNQVSVQTIPDGGLFQSQEWTAFQQACGKNTWSLEEGIYGTENTLPLGMGKYGYAPRFPGSKFTEREYQALKKYAHKRNWMFLRVEPQSREIQEHLFHGMSLKAVEALHDVQPREVLMLDITLDEETLLKEMKSKSRYNIRLAEKQGVTVEMTRNEEDVQAFLDIMESTAKRKSIHFHSRSYYQFFLVHLKREACELFVAKKDDVVLAGSIVYFYQGTAYYLHGGSGDTGRNLMAPHLLQWRQIQVAKQRGCKRYDFGGVAIKTPAAKGKDWSGITRFKQGFGPKTESLLFSGTHDLILQPVRYTLYRALYTLKKFL
ncbi:MAG: aminoacyltransferase [Candidatus Moranbacteria bacterium]|nr:aminoacyltransferase [Candidatus Moranbacteria bacterium]